MLDYSLLSPISDFIDCNFAVNNLSPNYYYEGHCPQTGELLRLPRTALIEAIARGLMNYLARDERYANEGKMYGVLLVELPSGEQRVIKAFSGLLNSQSVVEGWVLPIPGREAVAFSEAETLTKLDAIKQEIIALQQLPARQQYEILSAEFEQQLQVMSDRHRECRYQRQVQREILGETLTGEVLALALAELDEASRQDGIERRQLKRQRDTVLQPLQQSITAAETRIRELKQQRKTLSRQLQAEMHAAYSLMNFFGQSLTLQQLMPDGLPTGTGDCCAPKLLHYAATNHLKPLAMAEFWWGKSSGDKVQGEFYEACAERCQPLMGFLLSGMKPNPPLTNVGFLQSCGKWDEGDRGDKRDRGEKIIYQDEWLIAVNKPAGLLSVPGRYRDTQDSVLSRLRNLLADGMNLIPVHRLDQETSGILLIARDRHTHSHLSQQFQQRQVHKVYEAILAGAVTQNHGAIELPLWGNPQNRPYQQVDWQYGKPSVTQFQVIAKQGEYTRVEFIPLTGRTHQLRVHAAVGLGVVILGDRLYGCNAGANRLHLHAREISFYHPQLAKTLHLQATTPF
ncbi:RluA family pseudouridine synthase [Nostoc spongiaeforme FACHB-130]|uniref:RNA pseudouridylate synthase n=1 Tax=Nostoc spongiaeforme FACHB-130 TaxID=1357510 RepID=A0ABR8FVD0_9NOSO|nr:pseudouridine synthase [Nostoc spongiaeforme]MBD2595402.1 RluA family pseudouridine synthase [Nostoc spongiaeforme FACHB-130]